MTLYVVHNNQPGTIDATNVDGTLQPILSGSSATVDLTGTQYADLVALVGASNVTLVTSGTYRYAVLGFTPVAAATDVLLMQGSATMVVRIYKIKISGNCTVATGGAMNVQVLRRLSTGGTKGSAAYTAVVPGYHDINDPAPTAVVETIGTANVTTVQTSAGVLLTGLVGLPIITTTPYAGEGYAGVWNFNDAINGDKPIVLRGTSDFLAINLNGATLLTGQVINIEIETTESTT